MFFDTLATFVSVLGDLKEGSAQSQAAAYNRNISLINQQQTLNDGKVAVEQKRIAARQNVGLLRANVGASGFDMSGSAFDMLYSNTYQGELDAQYTDASYKSKAAAYGQEANMYGAKGASARTSSYISAAADVLKGKANYDKKNGADEAAGITPFRLG